MPTMRAPKPEPAQSWYTRSVQILNCQCGFSRDLSALQSGLIVYHCERLPDVLDNADAAILGSCQHVILSLTNKLLDAFFPTISI